MQTNEQTVDALRQLLNPSLFQPEPVAEPEYPFYLPEEWRGRPAVSVPEMAKALGISTASAYTLTHRTGFPCIMLGERRKVIPVKEFVEWLTKQTRG